MNFKLTHIPKRPEKPREKGLTMVMDKGLSLRQAEDLISSSKEQIDLLKLGFGTSFVTNNLAEKIKLYQSANIEVYPGGTLFEAFIARKKFRDFRKFLDQYNLDMCEVSDGSIVLDHKEKCEFISKLAKSKTVLSEVGSKEQGILINWQPFVSKPLRVPTTEVDDEDRSTKHYRIRGEYVANDLNRYAPHELIDIYKETDCQFADMGLMWLQVELRVNSDTIDNYVLSVFNYLWRDGGQIDSSKDIEQLLVSMEHIQSEVNKVSEGLSIRDAWQRYVKTRGLEHLETSRLRAQSASISTAPTFLIGSEPFQGRAQLPLITARLKAGI